jgi:D-beta-D-heptose 7-phosphate kinase/D-beta-D-heptose 1-phosphate adenosyltransferase
VTHLTVVGDVLLDRDVDGRVERLCPDAPVPVVDEPSARARPGGAGLAALLAAATGHSVTLVTAVGDDEAGGEVTALLRRAGVSVVDLGLIGATPEKVRVCSGGRPLVRLDYGGHAAGTGAVTDQARDAAADADAVLVSDYGRGLTAAPDVRALLGHAAARVPVVWDPHPRGAEPVTDVRLATPNRREAEQFAPGADGDALAAVTARARALLERWRARNVAVTLGARGALLVGGDGTPLMVPAPVADGDPCGAGDCFAATAVACLADGALPTEAVPAAVAAAAAFVARGGAGSVLLDEPTGVDAPWDERPEALAARVRAGGGTVVATGGCFDLLHAGHVQMLQAARALGDCLIVCLNSDASVRRLKGPTRPLTPATDRAAVLLGLGCVDAVAVFDEDTPEAILDLLRPHVWAKGADYAVADLPEAALVQTWGGQAIVLPYLPGRSTTNLVQLATKGPS